MQKIKKYYRINTKSFSVTVNVMGLLVAVLLIGSLAFYAFPRREAMKNRYLEGCPVETAKLSGEGGMATLSWEVVSAYRYLENVMFGIENADAHKGETVAIVFDNGKGFTQTQQHVVAGAQAEETCGMGLLQLVGRGSHCRISVTSAPDVIDDVKYLNLNYQYYDALLLGLLALSSLLLFFHLAIRLEGRKKWCRYMKKGYGIIRFLAMPLMMIWIMEYLGGSIITLSTRVLIANIVICTCLYLAAFIVTNRLRLSLIIINCILFIVAVANYFVLLFRTAPLLPYDVLSIRTAMAVVGEYEMKCSEMLVFSGFVFAAILLTACKMPYKIESRKMRAGFAAGGTALLIGMASFFYGFLYSHWDLWYSTWQPIETYQEDGYLMSTMIFAKYAKLQRPKGYSAKKAKEILASFAETKGGQPDSKPLNLIVIMNESWSALDYVRPVETNIPYDSFYQGLSENTIKGDLYVSICGGNTPQTEYEFFTGNSVSGLPNGATAYEFFVKEDTENICDSLKQEGYGCLAIHPFGAGSYHRDEVYGKFGFDKFITQKSFKGYEKIRDYYSDAATFEKVIELYEKKEPGSNLFVWDLTMQNHGGYGEWGDFAQDVYLTEYPELNQASMYLTLMKYTDEALERLITYFAQEEEPTMIVMFGDHQPALGDGTYDVLYGQEEKGVSEEEKEKRYITPFLIWNNYGLQEDNIERMSANYLSSYVFWQAGLPLTPYQNMQLDLYQYYPVVNVQGVYDAQGKYWSWEEAEKSQNYEKLHNYQIVQYYMIKK